MHTAAYMVLQGYRFGAPSQEAEDIDAQVVGRVEKNKGKKLTITSEFGKFVYDS